MNRKNHRIITHHQLPLTEMFLARLVERVPRHTKKASREIALARKSSTYSSIRKTYSFSLALYSITLLQA